MKEESMRSKLKRAKLALVKEPKKELTGSEILDQELDRRKDFFRFAIEEGKPTLKNSVRWEAKDIEGIPELRAGLTLMWSRPIDELYEGQTSKTVKDEGLVDIAKHVVWESIIMHMRAAIEQVFVQHLALIRKNLASFDLKATYFPGQIVKLPPDEIWEFRPNAKQEQFSTGHTPTYSMNLGWDQVYPEPIAPEITIQPKEEAKDE